MMEEGESLLLLGYRKSIRFIRFQFEWKVLHLVKRETDGQKGPQALYELRHKGRSLLILPVDKGKWLNKNGAFCLCNGVFLERKGTYFSLGSRVQKRFSFVASTDV